MSLAPIALFTFKRLDHIKQTIGALQKNILAPESELFIFSDGPRDEFEKIETAKVRQFLREIDGFKSIKIIERNQNLGLAKSIIQGVTELVNEFGKIIVIEDDLVTSRYFLNFMNDALEKYKDEEKIGCIHGYVYPLKISMKSPFFLRGADCWGWATWKRAWSLFEEDGNKLLRRMEASALTERFDFDNSYPYTKMLRDQIKGKNNSWAIRWSASLFLEDKLCLYPHLTLVENIGLDGSGTHCLNNQAGAKSGLEAIATHKVVLPHLQVSHCEIGYANFRDHFRQHFPRKNIVIRVMKRVIQTALNL